MQGDLSRPLQWSDCLVTLVLLAGGAPGETISLPVLGDPVSTHCVVRTEFANQSLPSAFVWLQPCPLLAKDFQAVLTALD